MSTAARPKTWGFVGLGQMGYPMAKDLRTHIPPSDKFVVLDINQDMMNRFIRESESSAGAVTETARNAREVAEKASVIITSFPSPQTVKDTTTLTTAKGALPPLENSRLFIDCSTIDPNSSRQVAIEVRETLDAHSIDAPMSGGAVGAQAGTLSFMYGAPEQLVDRVQDYVNGSWRIYVSEVAQHNAKRQAGSPTLRGCFWYIMNRQLLGQIATYMKDVGTRYGFLTEYKQTVFLRRDYINGSWRLYISDVVQHNAKRQPDSPSLRECFWYLMNRPAVGSGQVAKYMKQTGVRYGFLSTYNEKLLLKQDFVGGFWRLHVSGVVKHNAKSKTGLKKLLLVSHELTGGDYHVNNTHPIH